MRTLHSILDVNNDGVIAYDDFKLLANNFASLGNLKPEAHSEFLDILKQTWEAQWGEITPYNLVNAEQYLTEMHHTINDKELRAKIHHFLPYLFKVTDEYYVLERASLSVTVTGLFFVGRWQGSFRVHCARWIQIVFQLSRFDCRRCSCFICNYRSK